MSDLFAPPFIFLWASVLCALLPARGRAVLLLITPVVALISLLSYAHGQHVTVQMVGFELAFMRVDKLSIIFGIIFCIAAWLSGIYAWHVKDKVQQIATLAYAGSAIGGVFAGDLISLFIWWEGTALASVLLLLAGLLLHFHDTGSIAFGHLGLVSPATWLIFISFGIKCAFPLMHNWLQDAYPAATVTGTVVLSAFTTKMAVYALARGYAGTELLIYIGAIMTLFPIFFAEIENDLRRVLSYSLNNERGCGTFQNRNIKSIRAWRPLQIHAGNCDMLSGWSRVYIGLPFIQWLRVKVFDIGCLCQQWLLLGLVRLVGRISWRVKSFRHQDSVFHFLCP